MQCPACPLKPSWAQRCHEGLVRISPSLKPVLACRHLNSGPARLQGRGHHEMLRDAPLAEDRRAALESRGQERQATACQHIMWFCMPPSTLLCEALLEVWRIDLEPGQAFGEARWRQTGCSLRSEHWCSRTRRWRRLIVHHQCSFGCIRLAQRVSLKQ